VVSSKNEFSRLIKSGAIKNMANNEKIDDIKAVVGGGGIFKVGKKKFIEVSSL
jgi:tyrosyl-tRNA synthetase